MFNLGETCISLVQDDGGKKIELKPGFLMEHEEDVKLLICSF